jgi:hypothetical protein
MTKRPHKFELASCSITTQLDPATIAKLCEIAAKHSETIDTMARLEESSLGRLVYSLRNRLVGGRVEFMTFQVVLREENGRQQVETCILKYKLKRSWPFPWEMIAWKSYRNFMQALVAEVKTADPDADTSIVEIVGQDVHD